MTTVSWLHLSDWHQGTDNEFDRNVVGDAIIKDIANRNKISTQLQKPDFFVFSGDIAWGGKEEEYREAERFIDQVLGATGLDKQQVFLVPGNHDIAHGRFKYLPAALQKPLPDKNAAYEWLRGKEDLETLLKPFQAYTEFAKQYGNQPKSDFDIGNLGYAYSTKKDIKIANKRIRLLGFNSALLCGRKFSTEEKINDKEKLVLGEPQVYDLLRNAEDADLVISVIHHPFEWFMSDDRTPVEKRMRSASDFILYGHEHKPNIDGGQSTLGNAVLVPTGAAYDQRIANHPLYAVAYNFCHVDLETSDFTVFLRRWREGRQEIRPDDDTYKEGIYARKLLRIRSQNAPEIIASDENKDGWTHIDQSFLDAERSKLLHDEEMIHYFDGGYPDWSIVLSPNVKPRDYLRVLLNEIDQIRGPKIQVRVLRSPAGEGKSTILKQLAIRVATDVPGWNVWWYDSAFSSYLLTKTTATDIEAFSAFLGRLPITSGKHLIIIDEADLVIDELDYALRKYNNRTDLCFLLGVRTSDWQQTEVNTDIWERLSKFSYLPEIEGLSIEEAQRIIETWHSYGIKGLGEKFFRICGKDKQYISEAARIFKKAASPEDEDRNRRGSPGNISESLLGAMLSERYAEGLNSHVKTMLDRLDKTPIIGDKNLAEIFFYIAAIDAIESEARPILQIDILADALGTNVETLYSKVFKRFSKETALTSRPSTDVQTRHPKIAKAAIRIARKQYSPAYVAHIYCNLAQVARRMFLDKDNKSRNRSTSSMRLLRNNISKWNYLSQYFFETDDPENKELGLKLAEAIYDVEPDNLFLLVAYARLLRKTKRFEVALSHFEDDLRIYPGMKDRAYYYEWGTCLGEYNKHQLDILLSALSLSDIVPDRDATSFNNQRVKASLTGLGEAFNRIHQGGKKLIYLKASAAAVWIGFKADLDEATRKTLTDLNNSHRRYYFTGEFNLNTALDTLISGTRSVYEESHRQLPSGLLTPFYQTNQDKNRPLPFDDIFKFKKLVNFFTNRE